MNACSKAYISQRKKEDKEYEMNPKGCSVRTEACETISSMSRFIVLSFA